MPGIGIDRAFQVLENYHNQTVEQEKQSVPVTDKCIFGLTKYHKVIVIVVFIKQLNSYTAIQTPMVNLLGRRGVLGPVQGKLLKKSIQ